MQKDQRKNIYFFILLKMIFVKQTIFKLLVIFIWRKKTYVCKKWIFIEKVMLRKHGSATNIFVCLYIFRFLAALRHHMGVEYHQHKGEMFWGLAKHLGTKTQLSTFVEKPTCIILRVLFLQCCTIFKICIWSWITGEPNNKVRIFVICYCKSKLRKMWKIKKAILTHSSVINNFVFALLKVNFFSVLCAYTKKLNSSSLSR